jgi:hypothetical protein
MAPAAAVDVRTISPADLACVHEVARGGGERAGGGGAFQPHLLAGRDIAAQHAAAVPDEGARVRAGEREIGVGEEDASAHADRSGRVGQRSVVDGERAGAVDGAAGSVGERAAGDGERGAVECQRALVQPRPLEGGRLRDRDPAGVREGTDESA